MPTFQKHLSDIINQTRLEVVSQETARGAKWWNDANVLVMSLRAKSPEIANEILDAWFSEQVRPDEKPSIDQKYANKP